MANLSEECETCHAPPYVYCDCVDNHDESIDDALLEYDAMRVERDQYKAITVAAAKHMNKFRHSNDPLQGLAELFDALDAARSQGLITDDDLRTKEV